MNIQLPPVPKSKNLAVAVEDRLLQPGASTVGRKNQLLSLSFKIATAALACTFVVLGLPISAGTDEPDLTSVLVPPPFDLKIHLADVAGRVKKASDKPLLHAGVFAVEPSTGRFLSVDGGMPFAAASLIKVPVLIKLLDAIDKGHVKADEVLVLRQDLMGGGSGYLQWRPVDSKVSLREATEAMIVVSDNTATNLLIDRLGGKEALNEEFKAWGLKHTYINEWLPDLSGTNKTSPYDLAFMLGKVDSGDLLSATGKQRMLKIMEKTRIKTLLPQGLPPGAKISHKTGDIGSLVGDAGIITTPDGRRFLAAVQVERPHNDRRANELIRELSKMIYGAMTDSGTAGGVKTGAAPRCGRHG